MSHKILLLKTPLDYALRYRSIGWSVIPICTPIDENHCKQHGECGDRTGKRPLIEWKPYQNRLATEQEIREWWTRWKDANIGIVTGKISGIFVMDVDGAKGRTSIEGKFIPQTVTSITGRADGGEQYFFAYPDVGEIKSASGWLEGIDSRGEKGYVVAPPSLHHTGRRYQWKRSLF